MMDIRPRMADRQITRRAKRLAASYTIYVIRHPDTLVPVYVGKTSSTLTMRLAAHVSACKSTTNYLSSGHRLKQWFRGVTKTPVI